MSRTYELHFAVTVGCAAQKCSTTLKASIEINIAIKDDINKIDSTKKPKQRTGDTFHVVSLPKSSSTMHDLKRIVEQRLGRIGVDFSAYHTYSCALNGAIFTLLVVNLLGKNKGALFKSDLKEKKDEVEENGSVMVYSNGAFTICSSGATLQALRMLHLTADNDSIPLGRYRYGAGGFFPFFSLSKSPVANEKLGLEICLSCPARSKARLVKCSIEVVEKSMTQKDDSFEEQERVLPVLTQQLEGLGCEDMENIDGTNIFKIPRKLTEFIMPHLEPSIITRTYYREYFVVVKLKISVSLLRCHRVACVQSMLMPAGDLETYLCAPSYEAANGNRDFL